MRAVAFGAWWPLVLCAVLLWQLSALHSAARENVAPYYPKDFDQIQYLTESYTASDLLREHGLLDVLQQPRVQGMLLQLQAAVIFLATGPSRLAALDLNIAYFLVYVATTAAALQRTIGVPAALASVGLIAAATTTARVGGAFDFRLDFAAMCLWGTLLALLLLVARWRTRRGLLIVLLCMLAAALVLTRLIALVYVVVLFAGLSALTRVRALLVPFVAATVAAVVFVAHNWILVTNYYVGGHVLSNEKSLRALDVGVTDFVSSISFYANSLVHDHTGPTFLELGGLFVAASIVIAVAGGSAPGPRRAACTDSPALRWTVAVIALGFFGPYVALTGDESKSVVVGDVLVPPVVLAAASAFALVTRPTPGRRRIARGAGLLAGVAVLVIGVRSQYNQLQHSTYELTRTDLDAASRFMRDAGDYITSRDAGSAVWATDVHLDFTPPLVARLYYYEQQRKWLSLTSSLGDGPIDVALPADEVLRAAAASDVLVLTKGGGSIYPYDQSIERVEPELFAMAQQQYTLLHQYHIYGRDVFLYVR